MSARELLSDGPDGYVARRTAAVKAAKAAKDKQTAADLQALTKPTAALWAVLAAADDAALTRDLVQATADLASVQGGRGDRDALVAATKRRKELVEAVIGRAVDDAVRWGDVPTARRDEIRQIVERLSRAPEALGAWLDATLRTLPDDTGGFSAFEGLDLTPTRAPTPRPSRSARRQHTVRDTDEVLTVSAPPEPPPPPPPPPPRPDPVKLRRAERRVAEAEEALARAQRELDARRAELEALHG